MLAVTTPQQYLDHALQALSSEIDDFRPALDALQVPVYLTDAQGFVTYWNQACAEFAGRQPKLGEDRWCVTWQIYTSADEHLPHDRCPMAVAVKEKRAVRGEVAIALRPDGSRKAFLPYPTPLFGKDGKMRGAVNLLIDVSQEQAEELGDQAARCNRLAAAVCDRNTAEMLLGMAKGYERNAAALRASA